MATPVTAPSCLGRFLTLASSVNNNEISMNSSNNNNSGGGGGGGGGRQQVSSVQRASHEHGRRYEQ
jgi:hypothetical protein